MENSLQLLKKAIEEFGCLAGIGQVLTDRGTQFYANRRDKNGNAEINRFRFDNFDKFVNWYNTVRFHESLDTKWYLQTPDTAFWSRLPEGCKLGMFLNWMETVKSKHRNSC